MKIKSLILGILIISIVVNSIVVISFAYAKVQKISDVSSKASYGTLEDNAGQNLQNIAIGVRDSLDNQMQTQYQMVRSWASTPILLETARLAQSNTKEDLYEMWSAEATRVYDEGEATGDGNAANDINPEASDYLLTLTQTTGTYPEIFITDNRGYAVAASGATGDFDQGPEDWRIFLDTNGAPFFKRHKPAEGGEGWYRGTNEAADGFFIGEVEWDNSAATWGIDIVSQLQGGAAYLGQIKAVFDYGMFIQEFVKLKELNVHEIKVINQQGVIVATSEEDIEKVNNEEATLADLQFFKEVQNGKATGSSFETDEDGEEVFIGYAVSNDVNKHIVVVSRKTDDVVSPINAFVVSLQNEINNVGVELQQSIFLGVLLIGIVTLIFSFIIINVRITRPLDVLLETSDKLTDGNFNIKVPEIKNVGDEIQKIAGVYGFLIDIIKTLKKKKR